MKPSKFVTFQLIVAIVIACVFFKTGWEETQLKNQFQQNGVTTKATLVGYQYFETSIKNRGDLPVVSYVTADGTKLSHLAVEYGVITNDYQKKNLAKQDIYITYLPNNPSKAVVCQWKMPDYQYAGYFWGSLFLIAGLAGLIRQFYLTHQSSGTGEGALR